MISTFPLMAIALIGYNLLVYGLGINGTDWDRPVTSLMMMSGVTWSMTIRDVLIVVGLFLLFFEILKATRIGKLSIVDHLLSTLVLIGFIIEFLVVPAAATSTFFILMMMALVDVMAGFSVSIRSATRDLHVGDGAAL